MLRNKNYVPKYLKNLSINNRKGKQLTVRKLTINSKNMFAFFNIYMLIIIQTTIIFFTQRFIIIYNIP